MNSGWGLATVLLYSGWNWHAHEPGVLAQFHHLHQLVVRGEAAEAHAVFQQGLAVAVVHLVAMAVALADHFLLVGAEGAALAVEHTGPGPRRIVAPLTFTPLLVHHQVDHGVFQPSPNSLLLALFSPQMLRLNSITMTCMPRQMPKKGIRFSRA
jgi:hypothetical protein